MSAHADGAADSGSMLQHALKYARLSIPVFPVRSPTGITGACSCGKPRCKNAGSIPALHMVLRAPLLTKRRLGHGGQRGRLQTLRSRLGGNPASAYSTAARGTVLPLIATTSSSIYERCLDLFRKPVKR